MQLSIQNFSTFVENMAATVQGAASTLLDLTVGSVLRAILEANAAIALWLQWMIVQVLSSSRLSTSSGTDCDTFGADFSFTRLPAISASGQVQFARYSATNAAQLPVGTTVKTSDGTQSFTVILDTTNGAYQADPSGLTQGWYNLAAGTPSVTVTVQAATAGTGGNILAGTIGLIASPVSGIDTVTNPAAFTNGLNAESDTAFKARFQNYLVSLAKATAPAIAAVVGGVAQNLTWDILPNTTAGGTYQPGAFTVVVDDGSGATPSGTITAVQTALNNVRPVGTTGFAIAATALDANVTMTLVTAAGASHSAAVTAAGAAISAYIGALPVGAALSYTKLAQLAYDSNAAITNITGLLLNSGTADLAPTNLQVVRVGTLSIS